MKNIVCELHSPNLILRRFIPSDLYDFYEFASIKGLLECAGWRHVTSMDAAKKRIEDWSLDNFFAVVLKRERKLIGILYVEEPLFPLEGTGFEISYVMNPEYQHQGHATEAVREIIRYSFYRLGADYLSTGYPLDNPAARRVCEKCGFTEEQRYDYFNEATGKSEPSVNSVLLRKDYNKAHEFYQIYDDKMRKTDMMVERPSYVLDGYYFGVVDIITYNKRNHSFLITRRDRNKPYHPGMLECTCGAMQYGEDPLDSAVREVREETGIDAADLRPVTSGIHRHAVTFIYLNVCDVDPDSIVLQKNETDAYYWYEPEDFLELFHGTRVTEVQQNRLLPLLPGIIKSLKEEEHDH